MHQENAYITELKEGATRSSLGAGNRAQRGAVADALQQVGDAREGKRRGIAVAVVPNAVVPHQIRK